MAGGAWLNFLILVCTAGVAVFSLIKDWENHKHPIRRYSVLALIFAGLLFGGINLYVSNEHTKKAESKHAAEQAAANAQIVTLQNSVTAEQVSRHADTQLFLSSLATLNGQLSHLETDQKTKQLKQEIIHLQENLKESGKASAEVVRLHSASIKFGFGVPPSDTAPSDRSLPDTTTASKINGVVTVIVTGWNSSEVSASMGYIYLRVCASCKYAEEPENFRQAKGASEVDREMPFQLVGMKTNLEPIRLKVIPPGLPQTKSFEIGFRYVCQTCIENDWQKLTVNVQD